jgi:hypothetical protein
MFTMSLLRKIGKVFRKKLICFVLSKDLKCLPSGQDKRKLPVATDKHEDDVNRNF